MRTKCATCDEPKVGCLFCGRCGEAFDRWATVDVRCVPVATGDDVQRLLAELDEAGS